MRTTAFVLSRDRRRATVGDIMIVARSAGACRDHAIQRRSAAARGHSFWANSQAG